MTRLKLKTRFLITPYLPQEKELINGIAPEWLQLLPLKDDIYTRNSYKSKVMVILSIVRRGISKLEMSAASSVQTIVGVSMCSHSEMRYTHNITDADVAACRSNESRPLSNRKPGAGNPFRTRKHAGFYSRII